MSTVTPTHTPGAATGRPRSSLARVVSLARFNGLLMARNRMTLVYASVVPLLPLALLLLGGRPTIQGGITTITTVLLMALMFPVYYNLLSMFVARRDELVLKRLRTGETRDGELVLSMALPGVVIALAVMLVAAVLTVVVGLPLPTNPLLVLVAVLAGCAAFVGLALWTAAWTRNGEQAQITSLPAIVLASLGMVISVFPAAVRPWLALTPGGAVHDLVQVAWFGRSVEVGSVADVGFWASFVEAAPALGALVAWTVLAVWLARRSVRWEPRA